MTLKNPPHPGVVVLKECIEPMGLTITAQYYLAHVRRDCIKLKRLALA